MIRSTTISDDRNNDDQFLTPSLDISLSANHDVVDQSAVAAINDNNKNSLCTQSRTINIPESPTPESLSSSSSETSLARPLVNEKNKKMPIPLNSCLFMKYHLSDMFLSAFIITPLVTIHWRGAWDLLDIYLLPKNEYISALVSLTMGLFILYLIYLTQNFLQKFSEIYRKCIIERIITRFYTLIMALAYINQWRGLWNLLDLTSNNWFHLLIETLISVTFLLTMKSISSLNSAPFLISVDTESYFLIGSKCNVSTNRFRQYTFDFAFYEIIEASLAVIAWRGLYNLSDLFIYPDNNLLSMLISFLIGYFLFFLLALLQIPIIQYFIKQPYKSTYSCILSGFHLFAFISVVEIWRSLWMICEQYINIPGYHDLTLWLCYAGAYIVLTSTLTACSLNGPGGGKDNYIDDQPILLWKFDYLSILIKGQINSCTNERRYNELDSSSSMKMLIPP